MKPGYHKDEIVWEMNRYTRPTQAYPLEVVDETVGRFRVVASAQKYLAQVAMSKGDEVFARGDERLPRNFAKNRAKPMLLYEGGIQIYSDGVQVCDDETGKRVETEFGGHTLEEPVETQSW